MRGNDSTGPASSNFYLNYYNFFFVIMKEEQSCWCVLWDTLLPAALWCSEIKLLNILSSSLFYIVGIIKM